MQSEKTLKINLDVDDNKPELEESTIQILHSFLTSDTYKNQKLFEAGETYPFTFKDPLSNEIVTYFIEFNKQIIQRKAKKHQEHVKYDILDPAHIFERPLDHEPPKHLIGKGTYKDVYKPESIITVTKDKLLLKLNDKKKKSQKVLLIELIKDNNAKKIEREYKLDKHISDTKAKPITFLEKNNIKSSVRAIAFFDGEPLTKILGDLYNKKINLSALEKWQLTFNLLVALEKEHEHMINNDIAPQNILVNRDTQAVKIIDRGFAHKINQESHEKGGTIAFYSPERVIDFCKNNITKINSDLAELYLDNEDELKDTAITIKSDYYAMGIILNMLWNGQNAFNPKKYSIPKLLSLTLQNYLDDVNVLEDSFFNKKNELNEILYQLT